jgi:succinate-acetate transporter protein
VRFGRGARATRSHPRARAQRLDVLLGILGFFTLMAFIQTVVLEIRGQSAGFSALVLLVLVVAVGLAYRARRRTGV